LGALLYVARSAFGLTPLSYTRWFARLTCLFENRCHHRRRSAGDSRPM